ncbi:hypothetical protein [Nocardia sp. R7R-8]
MIARTAPALALPPQTVIPLGDDASIRRFGRDHVVVSVRVR